MLYLAVDDYRKTGAQKKKMSNNGICFELVFVTLEIENLKAFGAVLYIPADSHDHNRTSQAIKVIGWPFYLSYQILSSSAITTEDS
jgi:hypothetical protein